MNNLCIKSFLLLAFLSLSGYIHAQTYSESLLYNFCAPVGCTDNEGVRGNLIQANDGNFYGTDIGGTSTNGTLFRITPSGEFSVLHTFCPEGGDSCQDGAFPDDGVIQGGDGSLYGIAMEGGANGQGIVFKITLGGQYTILYNFGSLPDEADGVWPASLVQGSDGNFYGTTLTTAFRITPSGQLTTLSNDLSQALTLVQGTDGNFYGSAHGGIVNQYCQPSCGIIFRMTPTGQLTTLYSFCSQPNCADGTGSGPLVQAADGNFYGYTGGAPNSAYGAVFAFNPSETPTVLYTFCSENGCADGALPVDPLTVGSDGNLYGVTTFGGNIPLGIEGRYNGAGTIFRLTAPYTQANAFSSLYSFEQGEYTGGTLDDGEYPYAGVAQGSDGSFYGTTFEGGTAGSGTIYKFAVTPALPAPVQISLSSSTVSPGASVTATFQVLNAFSLTMQQCYAFSSYNGGAMSPLGKVTGTLTNNIYTGSATFTAGAQGTYNFALTCGGIESGFATLTVAGTPTTTALVANPNPPTVGQQVTLTAQVRRTSGGGFATGQVKFQSGSTLLGNSTLNGSGVATFTASTNGLPPGSYTVTATYEGDSADAASTSPSLPVTLGQAPTSVTLSANPTSVTPPANVALSATVTRSASGATGTPTGTVTFSSGTVTLATVNVNGSGVAAYSASSSGVPAGNYPLTAKYNGDASDTSSTSAAVDVTVK